MKDKGFCLDNHLNNATGAAQLGAPSPITDSRNYQFKYVFSYLRTNLWTPLLAPDPSLNVSPTGSGLLQMMKRKGIR